VRLHLVAANRESLIDAAYNLLAGPGGAISRGSTAGSFAVEPVGMIQHMPGLQLGPLVFWWAVRLHLVAATDGSPISAAKDLLTAPLVLLQGTSGSRVFAVQTGLLI
jgi:hypothetical protein